MQSLGSFLPLFLLPMSQNRSKYFQFYFWHISQSILGCWNKILETSYKSEIRVPSRFSSGEGLLPGLQTGTFSLYSPMAQRELWSLIHLNEHQSHHEGSTHLISSKSNYLQKIPPLNTTFQIRASKHEFGEYTTFNPQQHV